MLRVGGCGILANKNYYDLMYFEKENVFQFIPPLHLLCHDCKE